MIIELITPLMLASSPQAADANIDSYAHKSQLTTSHKEQIAYSSTRTYGGDGSPRDADWD